jgi:hypothetical protein
MLEFEIYYDFVKKHKPLRILEKIHELYPTHLDAVVKEHMYMRGYGYVRGGSYCDEILSSETEKLLHLEMNNAEKNAEKEVSDHRLSYEKLLQKYFFYNRKTPECGEKANLFNTETKRSLEGILVEKKRVLDDFKKYTIEKKRFMKLNQHANWLYSSYLNETVDWLRRTCTTTCTTTNATKDENIVKYRKILPLLKKLDGLYKTLRKGDLQQNHIKWCKHPEFILDDFFYHRHRVHLPRSIDDVNQLCDSFQYMANWVLNRMDEYRYDMSTWDYDIEWTTPRAIYMLEILEKNV